MSLADQIADKQADSSPNQDVDEFGIPIPTPETPEYWVARALIIHNRDANLSIDCLHLRNNALYLGHQPLKETENTLYDLTHLRHPVKKWELVAFYRTLHQYVPKLNRNFLQIAEDCYWDIKQAEIINRAEALERSKTDA